jgi:CubicO group peptidase (beta-lactamase class C family)
VDYGRFLQMLLDYGNYNGKTIFNPQTIELMTSNQIGEIKDRSFNPGGYGLGIGVNPGKDCGQTQGCYWGGSPYNTTFSLDYKKQMYAILLTQNGPWQHLNLMNDFQKIVAEEVK